MSVSDTQAPPEVNYSVRLLINVNAADPLQAVEQFMQRTLDYGLRGFTYAVMDLPPEGGEAEIVYVEDGQVYTMAELDAKLAEPEEASVG